MMRVWLQTALGVMMGCLSVATAHAALTYETQTTPEGTRYIVVVGEFEHTDDLSKFIGLVRSHNPSVVMFSSEGGNIYKAMELGRLIRSHRLDTFQIRNLECASACSLAFIGGTSRYATAGSIGVHKSSFRSSDGMSVDDAVSQVQQITADVITYMIEMGVDAGLLQLSLKYDSNDIRYLSRSEMQQFKVVNISEDVGKSVAASPPQSTQPPEVSRESGSASAPSEASLPVATSGRVRHPKGQAPMKAAPDGKSETIATLSNATPVRIVGGHERWYEVVSGQHRGFMHHTWIWVEQYDSGPFNQRHIQIKSFDNLPDAQAFMQSSPLSTSAYLVTNGWFAVTLRETFAEDQGKARVKVLKEAGSIPNDAFLTYANTYIRKVCCN